MRRTERTKTSIVSFEDLSGIREHNEAEEIRKHFNSYIKQKLVISDEISLQLANKFFDLIEELGNSLEKNRKNSRESLGMHISTENEDEICKNAMVTLALAKLEIRRDSYKQLLSIEHGDHPESLLHTDGKIILESTNDKDIKANNNTCLCNDNITNTSVFASIYTIASLIREGDKSKISCLSSSFDTNRDDNEQLNQLNDDIEKDTAINYSDALNIEDDNGTLDQANEKETIISNTSALDNEDDNGTLDQADEKKTIISNLNAVIDENEDGSLDQANDIIEIVSENVEATEIIKNLIAPEVKKYFSDSVLEKRSYSFEKMRSMFELNK